MFFLLWAYPLGPGGRQSGPGLVLILEHLESSLKIIRPLCGGYLLKYLDQCLGGFLVLG